MTAGPSRFWVVKHSGGWLAVGVCAFGRAADFATTWVALKQGRAMEAKAGVAQLLQVFGPYMGLIAYEALITTPAIFLGCYLVRHSRCARAAGGVPGMAERMFFFSIGVISLVVAVHNTRFLF